MAAGLVASIAVAAAIRDAQPPVATELDSLSPILEMRVFSSTFTAAALITGRPRAEEEGRDAGDLGASVARARTEVEEHAEMAAIDVLVASVKKKKSGIDDGGWMRIRVCLIFFGICPRTLR